MSAHLMGLFVLPGTCRGQAHARKQTGASGHLLGPKVEGWGLRFGPRRRLSLSPELGMAPEEQGETEQSSMLKTPLILGSSI